MPVFVSFILFNTCLNNLHWQWCQARFSTVPLRGFILSRFSPSLSKLLFQMAGCKIACYFCFYLLATSSQFLSQCLMCYRVSGAAKLCATWTLALKCFEMAWEATDINWEVSSNDFWNLLVCLETLSWLGKESQYAFKMSDNCNQSTAVAYVNFRNICLCYLSSLEFSKFY